MQQYSKNKINEYNNEVAILQNNLNAELGRVLYYTMEANQDESMALFLKINKNVEFNSNISPNVKPTENAKINSIDKRKDELKRKLKRNQISPSHYYGSRLKLDADLYKEHYNNFNKLNGDLLEKIRNKSPWSIWNSVFTFTELLFILLNVLGQVYLIITVYKENKTNKIN